MVHNADFLYIEFVFCVRGRFIMMLVVTISLFTNRLRSGITVIFVLTKELGKKINIYSVKSIVLSFLYYVFGIIVLHFFFYILG
jgi:hypothetical protein